MSRPRRHDSRPDARQAVLCAVTGIGLALAFVRADRVTSPLPSATGVRLISASDVSGTGDQPPSDAPIPLVTVEVDATQTEAADPAALRAAVDGALPWQDLPAATEAKETTPPPSQPIAPNWVIWGHLDGTRPVSRLILPDVLTAGSLSVYTARGPESTTILLANRAGRRVRTCVRVRLPRGVYTIERLTLQPVATANGSSVGPTEAVDRQEPQTQQPVSPTDEAVRSNENLSGLKRLEGCNLSRIGSVEKRGMLEPGQVVLYRYVDQSKIVHLSLAEAYRQLHLLASSYPGPAHRLRRMLQEGSPYQRGLGGSAEGRSLTRRLSCIHHLLLVAAQAQSLHRDYQMRHTINPDAGAGLMGALERLIDSLSETDATLLGLVPQVSIESDPAGYQIVTVALANTGSRDIQFVKLGLQTAELPDGGSCDPADPAFFGTLKPGQTVRAIFRLQYPAGMVVPASRCVADVCYFAGGGPAHLRPRPW